MFAYWKTINTKCYPNYYKFTNHSFRVSLNFRTLQSGAQKICGMCILSWKTDQGTDLILLLVKYHSVPFLYFGQTKIDLSKLGCRNWYRDLLLYKFLLKSKMAKIAPVSTVCILPTTSTEPKILQQDKLDSYP